MTEGRGPYRKSEARRREILDAALPVFGRNGFRGGSVREIAELAGMSAAGLLHHFGSKAGLLLAVLRDFDEREAGLVSAGDPRGVAALRALVAAARRATGQPGLAELGVMVAAEAADPAHPAHEPVEARRRWYRDFVARALSELAAEGRVRAGVEPSSAARTAVALMDGLRAQWVADPRSVDPAGDLEAYFRGLVTEDAWPVTTVPAGPAGLAGSAGHSPAAATGQRREGGGQVGGATILDVARATGLSAASVSRALNGKPGVSDSTRATVLAKAAELGFTGNATARALKSGRTGRIAVTLPWLHMDYAAHILSGAAEVLQDGGQSLALGTTVADGGSVLPALERLARHGVDGAVVVLPRSAPAEYARLEAAGLPVVLVDPVADAAARFPSVTLDNAGAGRLATAHLLGLGHRRIGVVTGETGLLSTRERLRGVREALREAGAELDPDLLFQGSYGRAESGRSATLAMLAGPRPPTAVFAFNDRIAFGVLQAARESGLDVPGELSVVGFDDDSAALMTPPLTTVAQPLARMGASAGRLLLDWLAGRDPGAARVELPGELVVRSSTAAPPDRDRAAK
ncbi:substrate-binding domain-containing protein [Nonomuraea sp. NPDC050328]|uniref:substrate-binding domain-containing protein n=1 Tax=Nonomuraea sp. NPDC050328 TaxID=3364361 RepID=UPI00379B7877